MKLPEKRKFKVNLKESKNLSPDSNYKLVKISVACFFIGSLLGLNYAYMTIISWLWGLRIFLVCISITYVFQILFLKTFIQMKRMEYMMTSLFGGAPILLALVLMLNFHIHLEERTEVYKLQKVIEKGIVQFFEVDGIPCKDNPDVCSVYVSELDIRQGTLVEITLAKGLFGFEVISEIKNIDSQ